MRFLAILVALVPLVGLAAGQTPTGSEARPAVAARLADAEEMRRKLGLTSEYDRPAGMDRLKIAVLDFGFEGLDGKKPYLPASAVVVEHYDPEFIRRFDLGDPAFQKPFTPGNSHGRSMAQIVWAITGFQPNGPQFYLLNANGPTLFRRAVRYAIEQRVDVILFSGVFEGAGNGEGRGFLNRAVADATAAGIIWVNAVGNFGKRTHQAPIRFGGDNTLMVGSSDQATLRFRNRLDENTLTVTLTWSDYQETEDAGTEKDLDLFVEDAEGRTVGSSQLRQVRGTAKEGESRNPRERVVLPDLAAGEYRIRIRAKERSLFGGTDQFRVLLSAEREEGPDFKTGETVPAVTFHDANGRGEIYPPADNPLVLAVGDLAATSSSGATADHRRKPDVVLADSRATFTNGLTTTGASNAAAYFAGIVLCLKAAEPALETRHLLALAHPRISTNRSYAQPALTRLSNGTWVRVASPAPSRQVWRTPSRLELQRLVGKDARASSPPPPAVPPRPRDNVLPP